MHANNPQASAAWGSARLGPPQLQAVVFKVSTIYKLR